MNARFAPVLILLAGSLLLFLPFLGSVHLFDWDEINFAEAAREMVVSGNYQLVQVDFQPFWEKPPLFIWLQALSMKVLGINEWAARLPNVAAAFFTFLLLYRIGTRHIAPMAGWIMVLVYAGSLTPHLYFRSGIIDPVFNLFMLLAIYQLYLSSLEANTSNNRHIHFLLAGLFTGLAVLTKGPVGLLIVGLSALIFYMVERFRGFPGIAELFSALLAFGLVVSVWFVPEWIRHGNWFMEKFITYQLDLFKGNMEAHAQPFWYHIPVLLLGCFPASILALANFRVDGSRNRETNLMHRWMQAVFWVVLIVFSLSKTKIVHYSSMCWFPLGFFAALTLLDVFRGKAGMRLRGMKISLFLISLLVGLAMVALPLLASNSGLQDLVLPHIRDPFAVAILRSTGNWHGWEWLIGLLWLLLSCGTVMLALFEKRRNLWLLVLPWATIVSMPWMAAYVLPPLERQIQGNYIGALRQLNTPENYVWTDGFKSYAPYFYPGRKEAWGGGEIKRLWLEGMKLNGAKDLRELTHEQSGAIENRIRQRLQSEQPLDRKVFVFVKTGKAMGFDTCRYYRFLQPAGGYRIYFRPAGR
jgi:4-amino-4-deoxy-L-arabinose transferase-like glycosyltransferase